MPEELGEWVRGSTIVSGFLTLNIVIALGVQRYARLSARILICLCSPDLRDCT